MELKDLKQDKRNYRKHDDRNISLIRKSVDELGLGRSIVIDNENEIIAGNGLVSSLSKDTPIKVIETDGKELVVVKRTDLKTNDEKRKKLAVMDNSTSDTSNFDMELLAMDFDNFQLEDMGIMRFGEISDNEEIMDNENLQEMNTNKRLALSSMPIKDYLLIKFDEEYTKQDFIDRVIKKINEKSDVTEKTQFCDYYFMEKKVDD